VNRRGVVVLGLQKVLFKSSLLHTDPDRSGLHGVAKAGMHQTINNSRQSFKV
jgi:hypothetical protein